MFLWDVWMWIWEGRRKVVIGYALFLVPLVILWGLSCFWLRLLCLKVANAKGGRTSKKAATPLVDSVLVALVAALLLHAVQRGS